MKNTPITARVKSGMFKTKEPLLNVGPAGVDGNNKTRNMPSPSKMKGYTMKSSPFKQESQAEKNVDEATKNETRLSFDGRGGAQAVGETTTTIEGTPGTKDTVIEGNSGSDAFKSAFADARKSGVKTFNFKGKSYSTELSKDPDFGKDKVVKGKSGTPDKVVKTKVKGDTFRKSEGDAQTPYERRQALRAAKRVARAQKSEQRKTDRLDRKEGKTTKTKKQQRIDRKRTQIKTNKAVADAEAKNVINQSKQNRSTTSNRSVRGEDVKNTAADFDTSEQIKGLTSDKKKSTFTTKKANAGTGYTPPTLDKVRSSFFKKKSPMKMNYFKK